MKELRVDTIHQRPSPIRERGSPAGEQVAHVRPHAQQQQQQQLLLTIGFQNIQGLAGKEEYVEWLMHNQRIDILCLAETWLTPGANHRFRPTTIADVRQPISETGRQGQGGILVVARTIALKDQVRQSAADTEKRHTTLTIGTTRLVVCYHAPRPEIDEQLFSLLAQLQATAENFVQTIVVGDINAKHPALGSSDTNPRGRALKLLVDETQWTAMEPEEGRFTTQNQRPDQVLVIGDPVVGFTVLEDVATTADHQPLVFQTPSALGDMEKEYMRLEIGKLREDGPRREYYSRMIAEYPQWQRRLERIAEPSLRASYEDRQRYADLVYDEIVTTTMRTVTATVGLTRVTRVHARRDFKTEKMIELEKVILDMQFLAQKGSHMARQFARRHIGETRQQLQVLVKERQREIFDQAAAAMDQGQTHVFQKMVSCMKGRALRTGCQLDPDGMSEYTRHFQATFGGRPAGTRPTNAALLNATDPHSNIVEAYDALNHELVDDIVRKLANGKSAGKDEIQAEMLKVRSPNATNDEQSERVVTKVLTWFFNKLTRLSIVPTIWKTAVVVPVWKQKGDVTDIANYRPIALTSVVRRVFEQCLLHQSLYRKIDEHLEDTQGGFRHKRSTFHQILVLHEACLSYPDAFKVFLDIKAAYDCVNRALVWDQLHSKFGLEPKEIQILRELFDSNMAQVRIRGHHGEEFAIARGFVQGSSLSPILFNVFINELIERLNTGPKIRISGLPVNNAFFADDGVLMTNSEDDMHVLLATTDVWALETGTKFAPTKCEVMSTRQAARPFKLHNTGLPSCTEYKYLGMIMQNTGLDWDASCEKRISSMKRMTNLLNSKGFNGRGWTTNCNMNVYRTFLRPMLEYGMALELLPAQALEKIEKAQNWALRRGLSLARTTSTLAILGTLGLDTMTFRNERLNARFMISLHESVDARVPAVMTYWQRKTAGNTLRRSLPYRFQHANEIYGRLHLRSAIERQPRRNPQAVDERAAQRALYNDYQIDLYRMEQRREIFQAQGNRVATYTVDPVNWSNLSTAPLVMSNKVIDDKRDRSRILWWMCGRVCYHQPCNTCEEPLTRKHGLHCSGAEELLRESFTELAASCPEDDERCLLDVVLQHVNFDIMAPAQRREKAYLVLSAIDVVLEQCAGRNLDGDAAAEEERDAADEQLKQEIQRCLGQLPARVQQQQRLRQQRHTEQHQQYQQHGQHNATADVPAPVHGAPSQQPAGRPPPPRLWNTLPRNRRPQRVLGRPRSAASEAESQRRIQLYRQQQQQQQPRDQQQQVIASPVVTTPPPPPVAIATDASSNQQQHANATASNTVATASTVATRTNPATSQHPSIDPG